MVYAKKLLIDYKNGNAHGQALIELEKLSEYHSEIDKPDIEITQLMSMVIDAIKNPWEIWIQKEESDDKRILKNLKIYKDDTAILVMGSFNEDKYLVLEDVKIFERENFEILDTHRQGFLFFCNDDLVERRK